MTSLLFHRTVPLENTVVTRKKNCLLLNCLLVLDKVNEVGARDRKPFLQQAGVRKRVREMEGLSFSRE